MNIEENLIWLDSVDSTNRYALDRLEELPDAALVVASKQTAGRGRHGRRWESPPDTNLYASFIMKRPGTNPAMASMAASLGALDALREAAAGVGFWIKWPNDIFVRNCKIAGILCESCTGKTGIVAGIGTNINMPGAALDAIDQPATSLLKETGREFNVKKFANQLALKLIEYYITYSISPEQLFERWRNENLLLGHNVEIVTGSNTVRGTVCDIGRNGELVLSVGTDTKRLFSGDVKINKNSIDFDLINRKFNC
ncbi:biotin--[acetyl-CoA-carboxylase] ligase [Lentisphaerota bacterium ZTH]|nr:biotin--[acetyl-CoA-carboxylase] ligase [Lentisphaerota bacterium]WET05692.1 biotin--[acetyl-CoA-carboxylase] ligase [Lentisphaerota bacterium ZTH]